MNDAPHSPDASGSPSVEGPSTGTRRALDALLNRLDEGLRTVEDGLRFDRSLASLPRRWRVVRHRVGALRRDLESALGGPLPLWRDTRSDPGVPDDEGRDAAATPHDSVDALLRANTARARESSRSLEEHLRTWRGDLARRAESIRYDIYALETTTLGLLSRAGRIADARLYALLTSELCSGAPLDVARRMLEGGVQLVQLREKSMPKPEFLALARELRELTAEYDVPLIINDDIAIAALSGADGVHQGQEDLPPFEVRKVLGATAIVGVSTHSPAQAERAEIDGADYIGVGPIFETRTKEHRSAVGLDYIAAAAEACSAPGFAIGSVNRDTIDAVLEAGAQRVAICTAIIGADDVEAAARYFRERIDRAVTA